MTEEMDERDLAVLELLKKDSRLSEQKISRKTGIPMTTVHNRIRKLRESGIIEHYTVRINHKKLGRPIVAYVLLKAVNQADQKELFAHISKLPQVYEVAMVTGEFDLLLKARVATMEELNEIVVQNLRKLKTIGETRTMISYITEEKD